MYWNILYVDDGEWIVDDADDLMQSARMSKAGENRRLATYSTYLSTRTQVNEPFVNNDSGPRIRPV